MFNDVKKSIGLVKFDRKNRKVGLLGAVPLKSLSNDSNLTATDLRKMFHVGEECRTLKFRIHNRTMFYRASADWSTLILVILPPGARLQANSRDLRYLVLDHKIYRYHQKDHLYKSIYSFYHKYHRYDLRNVGDRVIVSGALTKVMNTSASPTLNFTNYTFWIFLWEEDDHEL